MAGVELISLLSHDYGFSSERAETFMGVQFAMASVVENAVRGELMPSAWLNSPSSLKSNCSAKSPVTVMRARRIRPRSSKGC